MASISKRFVIIVGAEKLVSRLGAKRAVPVEVVPFAAPVARRSLEALGASVALRMDSGKPFTSDNGNEILDATFPRIDDPAQLESIVDRLPGVVDCGLFVGMAESVLVHEEDGTGTGDGFRRMSRP